MNKNELLGLIRKTQKDIKATMERLQYNINDLDEIKRYVILSVPDDVKSVERWTKEDSQILRGEHNARNEE